MNVVVHRSIILSALPMGLVVLGACETWPLYSHLPDPNLLPNDPDRIAFVEDGGEEGFQELILPGVPVVFTVQGTIDSCGWDDAAAIHSWPIQEVDTDGDGVSDSQSQITGWYTGDVDSYFWQWGEALSIRASLSWPAELPEGSNSPYRPAEVDGAWAQESDLDLVAVSVGSEGQPVAILSDGGVSLAHPEFLPGALTQPASDRIGLVVACHHGLASDYTLTVEASVF